MRVTQQIDALVNAPEKNHGTHLMMKDVLIEYVAQLDADLYWSRERTDQNTYPERKATLDRQIANLTTLRNYLYDTVAEFIDAGRVRNICDAIRTETLPVSAEN